MRLALQLALAIPVRATAISFSLFGGIYNGEHGLVQSRHLQPATDTPLACTSLDECNALLTEVEIGVLDREGKAIFCDPTCTTLESPYGVLHCNFFGIDQNCRACVSADRCVNGYDVELQEDCVPCPDGVGTPTTSGSTTTTTTTTTTPTPTTPTPTTPDPNPGPPPTPPSPPTPPTTTTDTGSGTSSTPPTTTTTGSGPTSTTFTQPNCDCMDRLTEVEKEVLITLDKTLYCDETCNYPPDSANGDAIYGQVHCNYFGLGQTCRACSFKATCLDGYDQTDGYACKPCSAREHTPTPAPTSSSVTTSTNTHSPATVAPTTTTSATDAATSAPTERGSASPSAAPSVSPSSTPTAGPTYLPNQCFIDAATGDYMYCDTSCSAEQPCFLDYNCAVDDPNASYLGCNVGQKWSCRFCEGSGIYSDIACACPTSTSATEAPTSEVTSPPSTSSSTSTHSICYSDAAGEPALCDDSCSYSEPCYIDPECGKSIATDPSVSYLGCDVGNKQLCRFCAFGIYSDIECTCNDSNSTTTTTTTSTTVSPPTSSGTAEATLAPTVTNSAYCTFTCPEPCSTDPCPQDEAGSCTDYSQGAGCLNCADGTFALSTGYPCIACEIPGCLACDSYTGCTKCEPGYSLAEDRDDSCGVGEGVFYCAADSCNITSPTSSSPSSGRTTTITKTVTHCIESGLPCDFEAVNNCCSGICGLNSDEKFYCT